MIQGLWGLTRGGGIGYINVFIFYYIWPRRSLWDIFSQLGMWYVQWRIVQWDIPDYLKREKRTGNLVQLTEIIIQVCR